MKNFESKLKYEELTPDLALLADIIGIEAVNKLIENLAGMSFYVPKIAKFPKYIQRIYEMEKDNYSIKEMSLKIGISEQYLRNLLHTKFRKIKT